MSSNSGNDVPSSSRAADVITLSDDEDGVPSEADVQHTYSQNVPLNTEELIPHEQPLNEEMGRMARNRRNILRLLRKVPKRFVNHEGDKFGFYNLYDSIDVVHISCEGANELDEEARHIDDDLDGVTCPEFYKLDIINRVRILFIFVRLLYNFFNEAYSETENRQMGIDDITKTVDNEMEWCIKLTRTYFDCLKAGHRQFRLGMDIAELLNWIKESTEFVEFIHDHACIKNFLLNR